ncbi:MAG: mannose-1-phosphate guanylyltransferase [Bacteroidetes bacterium]|nr:mannose-1-phosphate guanylyltransferase [Bacteroidota bacterium]
MPFKKNTYVVLMAGGVGVRFWPYSRNAKPKQYLDILGTGRSLLQATFDRFAPMCPVENIYVVTNQEHYDITREQLPELGANQILAEPMRKNTAPCIAYASWYIKSKNPDAVIVVSPSDHLILNEQQFRDTVAKAIEQARNQNCLITMGIRPTRPETGYGYIQYHQEKTPVKKVKTFTEKPELSIAKKFLESGDFVWNSGIFIWSVDAITEALKKFTPEIAEAFEDMEKHFGQTDEKKALENTYAQCKNISIDFGVMEKADNVYVIEANFPWSDLGSWGSLHEASIKDGDQNHVEGMVKTYDTRNCFIKGQQDKMMVIQGLNGYLIGWFDDVLIVCEKDREELFRKYVNDLKSNPDATKFL